MKKIFTWMLCAAIAAGFAGCSDYDDSALWKEIDQIKQEQEQLDLALEALESAVQQGALVTEIEQTADGYRIKLSDGKSYDLKQGDALLKDVVVEEGTVTLVLDGEKRIELPLASSTLLAFDEKVVTLRPEEVREVSFRAEGLETLILGDEPKDFAVELDAGNKVLRITAPAGMGMREGGDDHVLLLGADAEGHTLMAMLTVRFNPLPAEGGILVLNEGQFGKDPASVCIYNGSDWTNYALRYCNPEHKLGLTGTMTARHNGSFYFVSKNEPFVTEASADDLAFRSSLSDKTIYGQGRSIAVYDDKKAYFSAMNGLFEVGIAPLADGKRVFESKNGGGDVAVADGKVYFIDKKKLYVYDPATGAAPEEIGAAQTGFAAGEGTLWCGNATTLTRIDTRTATASTFPLGEETKLWANSTYAPSQIAGGGSKVFYLSGSGWSSKTVCAFDTATGTSELFWSVPEGNECYGSGLAYDSATDRLYVTYVESGYGDHYKVTHIAVLNSAGSVLETIDYSGHFWFPSKVFVL